MTWYDEFTNTARTGIAVVVYPYNDDWGIQVQRAPDTGASAPDVGNAETIAFLDPGTEVYVDLLPLDGDNRWYRSRHVDGTATPSAWTGWVGAIPALVPDPLPATPTLVFVTPQMTVIKSQSGSTGTIAVTVWDPDLLVTNLRFAEKTDAGAYGGLLSSWDTSTGTAGTDATLSRGESISMIGKHNVALQVFLDYVEDEISKGETRDLNFDSDFIAEIESAEVTVDDDGDVIVSATSDEDGANMYVTVGVDTPPSDPTSGSNDGAISGNSGFVNTGINLEIGETGFVKLIAYNSTPTAGPVKGVIKFRRGVGVKTVKAAFYSFTNLVTVQEGYADWTTEDAYIRPAGTAESRAIGAILLPQGVTLTESNMRWYRAATSDSQVFSLGYGSTGFALATHNRSGAGTTGWEIKTDSLNQLMDVDYAPVFIEGDANTDGDHVRFDYLEIEYTAPDVGDTL